MSGPSAIRGGGNKADHQNTPQHAAARELETIMQPVLKKSLIAASWLSLKATSLASLGP